MPWARLDDDFHDNGKILSLSHPAFRLYVCAITYCRRHRTGGYLSIDQALALSRQQSVPPRARAELVTKHAWHPDGTGYRIHDFEQYQPRDDETNAERQRRHRERHKTPRNGVTPAPTSSVSNGTVTRYGNDPVPIPIPSSAPTEHLLQDKTPDAVHTLLPAAAERASKPAKAIEPRYSDDFEAWWSAYPRKREKVDAYKAYQSTLKAGADPADLLAAAQHYAAAADEQGAEDRFIKLPATFLGPGRPWLDFRSGVPVAAPRSPATNGHHGAPSKLAQNAAILRSLLHTEEARG